MAATSTSRFSGKVAFITGAGSGIGRITALAFAAEGASVAAAGIAEADVVETVRLIEESGGRGLALACDVTQEGDVRAALDRTVEAFGRLDVAFNNAGIEQSKTPTAELSTEEWHRIIAVNLTGVFLCMKHEIAHMLRAGWRRDRQHLVRGRRHGFTGEPAYAAAKHGVIGLTKSAALEYAPSNIRINAVCPGIIDTAMMDRFTGDTDAGRDAVIARSRSGAWAGPKRSPPPCSGSAPTSRLHRRPRPRRRRRPDGGVNRTRRRRGR